MSNPLKLVPSIARQRMDRGVVNDEHGGEAPRVRWNDLSVARFGRICRWAGLAAVSLIAFILARTAVLNLFFTTGDLRDPGWIAFVTWRNGWRLHGPLGFPGPFFSEHIMPVLWLTDAVSYLLPLDRYDYYAALLGVAYAVFAAGVFTAWQLSDARITPARAVAAAFVALAATFSAVGVVALGLPHPEMAIPACAVWFLISLAKHARPGAACWFAACLSIREDAGFHLLTILLPWICIMLWRGRRVSHATGWLIGFATAALLYSSVAFVAKRIEFPAGDILWRSYLGQPPLHHVTSRLMLDRIRYYLTDLTFVSLPFLISLIWASISRNPLLPVGYVAAVPWLLLSAIAVHATPGSLSYYYGFPFWLALAWPLIGSRVWSDITGRPTARWPYPLLLLVSVIGWQRGHPVLYPLAANNFGDFRFAWNDTLTDRSRALAFADYYWVNRSSFGVTALDEAVSGLLIDRVGRDSWLEYWRDKPAPDTVMYFQHAFEWQTRVQPLLRSGFHGCVYAVPDTRILIASQLPLSERLPAPTPLLIVDQAPDARC
jgi:hypothetical protein